MNLIRSNTLLETSILLVPLESATGTALDAPFSEVAVLVPLVIVMSRIFKYSL